MIFRKEVGYKLIVSRLLVDAGGKHDDISEILVEVLEIGAEAVKHLLGALRVANVSQFVLACHFLDLSDICRLVVPSHFSI